jgi:hypothetical protein
MAYRSRALRCNEIAMIRASAEVRVGRAAGYLGGA